MVEVRPVRMFRFVSFCGCICASLCVQRVTTRRCATPWLCFEVKCVRLCGRTHGVGKCLRTSGFTMSESARRAWMGGGEKHQKQRRKRYEMDKID